MGIALSKSVVLRSSGSGGGGASQILEVCM